MMTNAQMTAAQLRAKHERLRKALELARYAAQSLPSKRHRAEAAAMVAAGERDLAAVTRELMARG